MNAVHVTILCSLPSLESKLLTAFFPMLLEFCTSWNIFQFIFHCQEATILNWIHFFDWWVTYCLVYCPFSMLPFAMNKFENRYISGTSSLSELVSMKDKFTIESILPNDSLYCFYWTLVKSVTFHLQLTNDQEEHAYFS